MAKKRPIKIITLDTETYNGLLGKLKRIAIYDGKDVTYGYTFTDVEKEINKLSKQYRVHCYIHNLEFDGRKIPDIFDKSRIVWASSRVINGKLAIVKNKKCTYHDSFKILPMSLKQLSKDFNVSHGKLDLLDAVHKTYGDRYDVIENGEVNYNKSLVKFLDECDVDDEIYLEYLGLDVISLYEVIQTIIQITGIDEEQFVNLISTASLSRHIYKNGFKDFKFKNPLSTRSDYEIMTSFNYTSQLDVEEFLRDAYCGGRCEVFKIYGENLKHYDVNSLYPSQMLDELPVGKPEYIKNKHLTEDRFNKWLEDKRGIGFLYCEVFIPEQNIPPLPVKKGKLTFPCGHVYGVWSFEELEYAVNECGCKITNYLECVYFSQTYPVFKLFVETLIKLKDEGTLTGNTALRTIAKLILNSGYGFTGMRRDDKTSLRDIEELDKYIDELVSANSELGFIEIPTEIKADYIQVGIACTITSRARLVLLKALKDCDTRGNVYYCDTDSIVTDVELDESLVDEVRLGFWDLESEPIKALFLRPKVYAEILEDKVNVKFKGVSRETQKDLDFQFYIDLLDELESNNKDSVIVEKNKLTFRSIMYMKKQGLDDDYFEERDKQFNLKTLQKREMNYKQNNTKPYYFNSIDEFDLFSFNNNKSRVNFSM